MNLSFVAAKRIGGDGVNNGFLGNVRNLVIQESKSGPPYFVGPWRLNALQGLLPKLGSTYRFQLYHSLHLLDGNFRLNVDYNFTCRVRVGASVCEGCVGIQELSWTGDRGREKEAQCPGRMDRHRRQESLEGRRWPEGWIKH